MVPKAEGRFPRISHAEIHANIIRVILILCDEAMRECWKILEENISKTLKLVLSPIKEVRIPRIVHHGGIDLVDH